MTIHMQTSVKTFLMFEGKAEEAITFYISLLENSSITSVTCYGPGEAGPEGTVMLAAFTLAGRPHLAIDSPAKHAFGFTPAMSLFLECASEAEVDRVFNALAEGGQVLMPLGAYPFNKKYGWVNDRFGVSWQIALMSTSA